MPAAWRPMALLVNSGRASSGALLPRKGPRACAVMTLWPSTEPSTMFSPILVASCANTLRAARSVSRLQTCELQATQVSC